MATTDPLEPQPNPEHGAMIRAVGDEMAAIFGSGSGSGSGDAIRRRSLNPPVRARSAKRHRGMLIAVGSILATTLAAGIYAGNSVSVAPVAAPASRIGHPVPQFAERPEPASRSVVTDVVILPASSHPAAPTVERRPPSAPVTTDEAVKLPPVPLSPARKAAPATLPAIRSWPPVPTAPIAPASPPSSSYAASLQSGCKESEAECVAQRFDVAEQRVADAYEHAVSAGVRRQALHRSRIALDRARAELAMRPQYALRLYGLIASDLDGLAEDAAVLARARAQ